MPTQTNGRLSECSHSSSSPTPSDMSSQLEDPALSVLEIVKVESPRSVSVERKPASAMLQTLVDFSCHVQATHPSWSPSRVLEEIRCAADKGGFGNLQPLLYPCTGPIGGPSHLAEMAVPLAQTHPGYPTYVTPMPSVPSAMPPPSAYTGTVNPATLTVIDQPYLSYTDPLTRTDSRNGNIDSDGSTSTLADLDYETTRYHYVSLLGLSQQLTPQEPQGPYAVPLMAYPVDVVRDNYYRGGFFSWET
jgi:hypothetical protein